MLEVEGEFLKKEKSINEKNRYNTSRYSIEPNLIDRNIIKKSKVRGCNFKFRVFGTNDGSIVWKTLNISCKTKILSTLHHPSNDRMAKKKILTKGSIVLIDSLAFKNIIINNYKSFLGKFFSNKKALLVLKLINAGFLFAKISSRPGQKGRVNGYVLENKELITFVRSKQRFRKLLFKLRL